MKNELTTPQLTPAVQTLVETIRNEIEAGKERAYLAMEQEKRLTYWNVGKHIKEHLLQNPLSKNQGREEYGTYVITQLAQELDLARNLLYDSVRFYEQYPEIVHAHAQFTWSHIRVLVHVPDKQARQAFEQKIIDEKLSSKELQKLVNSTKKKYNKPKIPTLKVERGQPYTYCLKKLQKQSMIDLGFRFYMKNPFAEAENESLIKTEKIEQSYRFVPAGKEVVPYYTYKAYVIEVIDGDTLWVNIDLGFDMWSNQKIRLKGINTKELTNKEGQNAKEFMEAKLKGCKFIAIKTYWRDKFTRYLADIFYKKRETDLYNIIENGKHLNQELLNEELAVWYSS